MHSSKSKWYFQSQYIDFLAREIPMRIQRCDAMRCDGPHCTLNAARTSAMHGTKLQNECRAAVVARSCCRLPFGRSLSQLILFICCSRSGTRTPTLPTVGSRQPPRRILDSPRISGRRTVGSTVREECVL